VAKQIINREMRGNTLPIQRPRILENAQIFIGFEKYRHHENNYTLTK